ncbi:hypothetical protein MTP99_004756 [Tenebrio molitor]|nr:hypothetical protein MTP99_004756 [Tenebrio molitor]
MSSLLKFCCVFLLVKVFEATPILTISKLTESDFRYCGGGVISSTEDKLEFFLWSRITSELIIFLVVHDGQPRVFLTLNEGGRSNFYSISSNNITKNGNIIERYDNYDLQNIAVKISTDDSSWKIRNVCEHGIVEPCKISCSNNEEFHYKIEENIKENPPNSSGT